MLSLACSVAQMLGLNTWAEIICCKHTRGGLKQIVACSLVVGQTKTSHAHPPVLGQNKLLWAHTPGYVQGISSMSLCLHDVAKTA